MEQIAGDEGSGKIPEDLDIAFRVLCNAAKTDKARLQALEVDVARLGQRAENAEKSRVMLQDRLQQLQVEMTKKEKDFNTQMAVQADRHRADVAALQRKLSQRGFDLLKRQHQMAGLRQQLEEALLRAKRAEAAKAAIWEKHTALAGNLSALLSTAAVAGPCSSYGGSFSNMLFSPRTIQHTVEAARHGDADNTAAAPGLVHSCASVPEGLSSPALSSCQGPPDTPNPEIQPPTAAVSPTPAPTPAASRSGSPIPLPTRTQVASLKQPGQLSLSTKQLVSPESSHAYTAVSPAAAAAPALTSAPPAAPATAESVTAPAPQEAAAAGSSGNKACPPRHEVRPVAPANPDTMSKPPATDGKGAPASLQVVLVSLPPIKIPPRPQQKQQQQQQQPVQLQLNRTERRSLLARLGITQTKLPVTGSPAVEVAAPAAQAATQGAAALQSSNLPEEASEVFDTDLLLADGSSCSSSSTSKVQPPNPQGQQGLHSRGTVPTKNNRQQQQQQQQQAVTGDKAMRKADCRVPASGRILSSQGATVGGAPRLTAKSDAATNTSSATAAPVQQGQSSSGAAGPLSHKQHMLVQTGPQGSCRASPGAAGVLAGVELGSNVGKATLCKTCNNNSSGNLTRGARPASSGGSSSSMSGIVTNAIRHFSSNSSSEHAAANARAAGSSSGSKAGLMQRSVSPAEAAACVVVGHGSSSITGRKPCQGNSPERSSTSSRATAASGKLGASSSTGSRRPPGTPAALGQLASAYSLSSSALSRTGSLGSGYSSHSIGKLSYFAAPPQEGAAVGALPLAAGPAHLRNQRVVAAEDAGPTAMAVYKQLFCTPSWECRQTYESV